ncbi:MAG: STAS domain-containing protein [Methylovulum sp.]|nr:STAS domain-containing protein [Methylovulum sp.]
MAENDDIESNKNSLIGYDPLAWMDEASEDYPPTNAILPDDDIAELQRAIGVNNDDDSSWENEASQPEIADDDSDSPVHLSATLNIQHVVALHERLKKVLTAHDLIEINASDVASIDTATFQLLVALKKDAVKLQKIVIFNSPSPRFIESAKLLGLLEILDV